MGTSKIGIIMGVKFEFFKPKLSDVEFAGHQIPPFGEMQDMRHAAYFATASVS